LFIFHDANQSFKIETSDKIIETETQCFFLFDGPSETVVFYLNLYC